MKWTGRVDRRTFATTFPWINRAPGREMPHTSYAFCVICRPISWAEQRELLKYHARHRCPSTILAGIYVLLSLIQQLQQTEHVGMLFYQPTGSHVRNVQRTQLPVQISWRHHIFDDILHTGRRKMRRRMAAWTPPCSSERTSWRTKMSNARTQSG